MPLTLMAVHAHPDDEAIGTGGVLAMAHAEGIRTVVVTCTNGEFGDMPGGIKPGQEGHDEGKVAFIRRRELNEAVAKLGVDHLEMLGYHDSGMVDWEYKERYDAFARVPVEEAAGRLAALFEDYQPDVVITYEEEAAYDHPDHVQTARITAAAVKETGIPKKFYLTSLNRKGWDKIAKVLEERGIESPFKDPSPEWLKKLDDSAAKITTTVDVSAFVVQKRDALLCHASQMDQSFFAKLPADVFDLAFVEENFIRALDMTGTPVPETDIFAGLR